MLSARRAGMLYEKSWAAGWSTTYWKALLYALFLVFETSTIEYRTRTMQEWLPRGVVYTLRSVQEVRVASMHTLRVYYILLRGCLLCLFSCMAVEGREDERAEVKHPRFLYVADDD